MARLCGNCAFIRNRKTLYSEVCIKHCDKVHRFFSACDDYRIDYSDAIKRINTKESVE